MKTLKKSDSLSRSYPISIYWSNPLWITYPYNPLHSGGVNRNAQMQHDPAPPEQMGELPRSRGEHAPASSYHRDLLHHSQLQTSACGYE